MAHIVPHCVYQPEKVDTEKIFQLNIFSKVDNRVIFVQFDFSKVDIPYCSVRRERGEYKFHTVRVVDDSDRNIRHVFRQDNH